MPFLKSPKVVLFDLYATLIDIETDEYSEDVWRGLSAYLRRNGDEVDGERLRQAYEARIRLQQSSSSECYPEVRVSDAMSGALEELGYRYSTTQCRGVLQVFRSLSTRRFGLFSDTLPVLDELRSRFVLGLVSDAQRVFFEDELDRTGLLRYFNVAVCSSDYPFHKPDQRMFNLALNSFSVRADEAVYIGDSLDRDIVGSKSAGLAAVLLDRGGNFSGPPEHDGPDVVIGSLTDLRYLL